ncbi:MAG: AI-2E family transporter, partial [Patescibacteria group bacterium]|nr:AI-2E family transporter [Patescibacteria group bacterium]
SYIFFVLLLGVAVAAVMILLPFLSPVVLGLVTAMILYPFYRALQSVFGSGSWGRSLSAFLTVICVAVIVLVPLFFLTGTIYAEIQTLYAMLTDEGNRSELINTLNNASQLFSNMVFGVLPAPSFDSFNITLYIKSALELAFANLDTVFTSLAKVAGYALIFLMSVFYFLRDGMSLKRLFMSWSPLLSDNEAYISATFQRAVRSVFTGTLAVSVLEGISIGLAFLVFGIPAPALWGTVAAVAALVPGFGVTLLVIPGTAYLILSGNYIYASGLFIWGYAGIILIDHIIGPMLVNKGVRIHPFAVLLSVLGGLLSFGLIGFVLGPIILVCLFTLLEIYRKSATWHS